MKLPMSIRRFQPFNRLQQRFRRSRPGSVLILVVALLVLLALLGTAYINTTQTDRYSSAQNSFNTEIDLLLQGVENITQASVVNALFGPTPSFTFHQNTNTTPSEYDLSDYPLNKQGTFIADRYPTLLTPTAVPSAANPPLWQFITALPNASKFESPYVNGAVSPAGVYTTRKQLYPSYLSIQQGGVSQIFPSLFDGTHNYLAGDADGDGIADSALFKLPIGQINGVTYYGGVRVVDNAAAINAAIALQPNPVVSTLPGNFFPTNIDLNGLLVASDQGANFTAFNTTARFAGQPAPNPAPADDATGAARGDFSFATPSEAFWMQVGRRLANPGYYSTAAGKYVALPTSEMQTMESRFILHDAGATQSNTSSPLEKYLFNSCLLGSPSTPYSADKTVPWATANFDFVTGGMPLRSMLVTQNGVSNFTYSKLRSAGTWNNTTKYNFGDWVTWTDANGATRSYVAMQQGTGNQPQMGAGNAFWEPQSWTTGPTKVSANTATFGQLWAAYYSAMTDAPITPTSLGTTNAMAAMFKPSFRTVYGDPAHPWEISGQGTGTPGFPQMQLRAALAAINTLQLRNPSSGSTTAPPLSHSITVTDANGNPGYNITVYGNAPQPYITEVYADTSGGTGNNYVAVELYNPYPFAIPLTGWQLATISRPAPPPTSLTVSNSIDPAALTGQTIPANGYMVIASAATPPARITTPPTATAGGATPLVVVPTLAAGALDNELVLLRPAASGTPGSFFTTGITATVPVDAYDFTGLPDTDPSPGHEWHYVRPSDAAAGKAWHFVYPGPYDMSSSTDAMHPRQTGTLPAATPATTDLSSLGKADAALLVAAAPSENSFIDRPLQINNLAFAGPNKAGASGNLFPYGGFARNADLLQVTYIGAYQITDLTGTKLFNLNSLPGDSSQANDAPMTQDANPVNAVISMQSGRENIGRFCPVNWADTVDATGKPVTSTETGYPSPIWDDYIYPFPAPGPAPANWPQKTEYYWTPRLFDYVTTQAPQDDYLPDVDPASGVYPAAAAPQPVANVNGTVANSGYANPTVTTSTNTPVSANEETVPVHGRININTANWRVLATLPFFDNPPNQAAANDLARAIVYYRDVDDSTVPITSPQTVPLHPHGAFQSIFELNNVPITAASNPTTLVPVAPVTAPLPLTAPTTTFRTLFGQYSSTPFVVPGLHGSNADGDISPNSATAGADTVYGDFENQNLALNRISNLITTRSDSFTAYVIVQGWRNAGTASPQLVVQRRGAFIIDRSTVTPANVTQPAITNVPTN